MDRLLDEARCGPTFLRQPAVARVVLDSIYRGAEIGHYQLDADDWDRQIEADAKSGKLSRLAGQALRDHEAGRSTEL